MKALLLYMCRFSITSLLCLPLSLPQAGENVTKCTRRPVRLFLLKPTKSYNGVWIMPEIRESMLFYSVSYEMYLCVSWWVGVFMSYEMNTAIVYTELHKVKGLSALAHQLRSNCDRI